MHRPSSLASSRSGSSGSACGTPLGSKSTPSARRHFAGHQLDTFLKRHIPRVQRLELGLVVAGVHDGIGQFSAPSPPCSQCVDRATRARPLRTAHGLWRFPPWCRSQKALMHTTGDTPERFTVLMVQQVAAACLHEAPRSRYGIPQAEDAPARYGRAAAASSARTVATTTAASGVKTAVLALEVQISHTPMSRQETGLRNMVFIQRGRSGPR